jgi:hypothetical protein
MKQFAVVSGLVAFQAAVSLCNTYRIFSCSCPLPHIRLAFFATAFLYIHIGRFT